MPPFGNDAATRSEAEALHQALFAVTRKTVKSSVPHRISCMHITLSVRKPSRRIREYEQRVSEEFNVELVYAEVRISRLCESKAQAFHEAEMRRKTSEFKTGH